MKFVHSWTHPKGKKHPWAQAILVFIGAVWMAALGRLDTPEARIALIQLLEGK